LHYQLRTNYPSGRGRDWVKKTCAQRETLMIAGFALDGNDWDGIYLGRRKGADLVYAGKVDHGFDKQSSADLRKRLTPLIRKTQPYTNRIGHKGIWVEPELLAEIEYRATASSSGRLAHETKAIQALHRMAFAGTVPLLAKIPSPMKAPSSSLEQGHDHATANLALDEFMKRRGDLRSGIGFGQEAPALGQVAIGDPGLA
jgi:hypothetical protein